MWEVILIHEGTDIGVFPAPEQRDPQGEYLSLREAEALAQRSADAERKRGRLCNWFVFDAPFGAEVE